MYEELVVNVNLIIHNAWQIDFNLSLFYFENGHVGDVRNLVDLLTRFLRRSQFVFLFSIDVVNNWTVNHSDDVSEEIIVDFSVAEIMSYAESKLISERLVDLTTTKCDIDVSICRIDQIADLAHDEKEKWTTREWLSDLLLNFMHLAALSERLRSMNEIDWVLVDIVSSIIAELTLNRPQRFTSKTKVYHIVNSERTIWATLLSVIQKQLDDAIQRVSLAMWVQKLRASAVKFVSENELKKNSIVKLLNFYEKLLATAKASIKLKTKET